MNKKQIYDSDDNNYNLIQYVLMGFMFISQFSAKSTEISNFNTNCNNEQKIIADKLFWKYIILSQIAKIIHQCVNIFKIELFETYHSINTSFISSLISISHISSAIFGVLIVGNLIDRKNKVISIYIYNLIMILSGILRLIKSLNSIILSQIINGFAYSLLYSSYDSWFISLCNEKITDYEIRNNLIINTFEKNFLSESIITVAVYFILNIVKQKYGIISINYVIILLSIINITLSYCFISKTKNKNKQSFHIKKLFSLFKSNKNVFLILLIETLFLGANSLFSIFWSPLLKSLNPKFNNTKFIFIGIMANLAGCSSFRLLYNYYNKNVFTLSRIFSFICLVGLLLCYTRKDFNNVLYGVLCFQGGLGLYYPLYSVMKSELFPLEQYGTFLNIFKFPINIFCGILTYSNNKLITHEQMYLVAFILMFLSNVIQFLLLRNNVQEQSIQDKKKQ